MENVSLYTNNNRIHAVDTALRVSVKPQEILRKHSLFTRIGSCYVLMTTDDSTMFSTFNRLYKPAGMTSGTHFILSISFYCYGTDFRRDNIFWIDQREGFRKGMDINYTYFINEYIGAKLSHDSNSVSIYCEPKDFENNIEYIIRIIEGAVVNSHIHEGFFPIHGALIRKDDTVCLIMGNSHSGKTTYASIQKKNEYEVLSDDIVFMDSMYRIYPFGQYIKHYTDSDVMGSRNIDTLEIRADSFYGLHLTAVYITEICCKLTRTEYYEVIALQKDHSFSEYISEYPNSFFLCEREFNYSFAQRIINFLMQRDLFLVRHNFRIKEGRGMDVKK